MNFFEDFCIQTFHQRNENTNDKKKQKYFVCNLWYKTQPNMRVIIIPHSPVIRLAFVQGGSPYLLHHSPPLVAFWLWYSMV